MRTRTDSGYSLVEILGAIAIMGTALVMAFDLIDHARRVSAEASAAASDPMTLRAELRLRRDLQRAVALPEAGTTSRGTLLIELDGGAEVEWRREGGSLVRTERTGDKAPVATREIPRQVTDWSWKVLSPALLEASYVVDRTPPPTGVSVPGPPRSAKLGVRTVVQVSPRGIHGGGSW